MKLKLLFLLMLGALIAGCSKTENGNEPTAAELKMAQETGSKYAAALMSGLKDTLQTAIREKGVAGAVDVCNVQAMPLTRQAEGEGVSIKRTTNKYRNPENAPDETEKAALAYFETQLKESGSLPENYVQKVSENGAQFLYFYKPMQMAAVCLSCHGDPATMDENLLATLDQHYPNDMARGYSEGDFRGAIRVKIPLK